MTRRTNLPLPITIRVGKRVLRTTQAFDTYWYLAAERQALFQRRLVDLPPPWTLDPILARHRFTNVFRVTDRVSQFVVSDVIGGADSLRAPDVAFRVVLFKIFNRIETWQHLENKGGRITLDTFDRRFLTAVLDKRLGSGERVYSAAYIMPPPRLGMERKHANHLKLLDVLRRRRFFEQLSEAPSLAEGFRILRSAPSFGDFLSFQFAIDINYSDIWNFSEMDFVVAGPGARSGISKCFTDTAGLSDEDVIRVMTEIADAQFARMGLQFHGLGDRAMQLIDCQNMFCELDKYARVAHPELNSGSGRRRIKQIYRPTNRPVSCDLPAKWDVDLTGWLNKAMPVVAGSETRHIATSSSSGE